MTEERPPKARFSWHAPEGRLVRRGLLLAALTFALGFLLTAGWMWIGAGGRDVVTVPNLRELSVDDAEEVVEVSPCHENEAASRGEYVLERSDRFGAYRAVGRECAVIVRGQQVVPHPSRPWCWRVWRARRQAVRACKEKSCWRPRSGPVPATRSAGNKR